MAKQRSAQHRCNSLLLAVFLLFLIVPIIFIGCGPATVIKAFQKILPGKSIRNYSSFEVIDDFDNSALKNHYQKEWLVSSSKNARATLEADKRNSTGRYGASLSVRYDIPQKERVQISSGLNDLDISQAELLVGRVEASAWAKFGGEAFVEIADLYGNLKKVQIYPPYIHKNEQGAGDWLDIELPIGLFRGVDLNALNQFRLYLESPDTAISGVLLFDEFAFYGPDNLFVESAKDNLKGFADDDKLHLGQAKLAKLNDDKLFLREIAQATWNYFDQIIDKKTNLPLDHIRNGREKGVGSYTSPTNIAFYWLSCVAASDLGFIRRSEAIARIKASFRSIEKLALSKNGFYFNFYRTSSLKPTSHFVSTIDNGWFLAALVIVRQAFPNQFDSTISRIFRKIDFSEFYDPSKGQIRLGFDEDKGQFSDSHYGLLVSEARLISYIAIGKGDLPKEHWARIYRTPPKEWKWQRQTPQGHEHELFGVPIFEGYYHYNQRKIVPSWGGSLFEFLAPSLVVNEQTLGQANIGFNNLVATTLHIEYALKNKKYPVWGIAPAAVPNGKGWAYKEFGISEIAVKGYPDEGVIAPYASALAIEVKPESVIINFRNLLKNYADIYGPYGFYDSVDVTRGRVNHQYLAVDQGMTLVALTNYLTGGSIRNRFHEDLVGKDVEKLLKKERFFV